MDWTPAIATNVLFALILWLCRSLISTRLTKSVESEFNKKLEKLKSELRAREATIDALRDGAMSGLFSRQEKLYERQLDAIEQIWNAVTELGKAKAISATISVMNYEEAEKKAISSPKMRQAIEAMGGGFDIKNIDLKSASKARPFLPPLVWAYYNAYQAILLLDVMKFTALKSGISGQNLLDHNRVTNLVKAVLPHRTDYLDRYGNSVLYHLLEEIENLLLGELQQFQRGDTSDQENVERAAEILRATEKLKESISST